ncbi:MAG: agmatine deiminase family protein [Actinomycetes bacterium]
MSDPSETPVEAGFAMPAEWAPHQGCLMTWPSRLELWDGEIEAAKDDYATVASAISAFEPVTMVCNADDAHEVRRRCGAGTEPLAMRVDDSWMRDNGPIFVRNGAGEVAVVDFEFNAWGERWHPYDNDNAVPRAVADHFGMRVFKAPIVLEGGSFFVDGEGTLITTEQCLLDPNRNGHLNRDQIERVLRDYLAVTSIIWLKFGHSTDVGPAGTDGHIDGVLQYVAPGHVLLEATSDASDAEYERSQDNLSVLKTTRDAAGRPFQITVLDPGTSSDLSYSNFYLPNGGVVVPVAGRPADDAALETIRKAYPDREVVAVPGRTLAFGGGGPHCITQQIPQGPSARP